MPRSLAELYAEVKCDYTTRWHHIAMGTMGKRITEARKAIRLTQSQLGEQLGVTKGAVSTWETGRNVPDLPLFISLCEKLRVSADYLLWNKRPNQYSPEVIELAQRISLLDDKKRDLLVSIFTSNS